MFPLLRLDPLSRECVLSHLTPSELFRLSLCSRISTVLVKPIIARSLSFYSLDLHLDEDYSIGVQYDDEETGEFEYFSCHAKKLQDFSNVFLPEKVFSGSKIDTTSNSSNVTFYFKNGLEGFKKLLDFVLNLYSKPIEILYLGNSSEKTIEILKKINSRQNSIKFGHVALDSQESSNSKLSEIFELLKIEELDLEVVPDSEFIKNDVRIFEFQELTVSQGFWITPERLLTMNCRMLTLNGTPLKNDDINGFLKNWIQGGTPNLEKLTTNVLRIDVLKILEGIKYTKKQEDVDGRISPKSEPLLDPAQYEIQRRSAGKIAEIYITIFNENPVFNMKIETQGS